MPPVDESRAAPAAPDGARAAPAPALPVTIVGGYLGAGKTTLVNHLLRHANGLRIAVLVNDFGDLPIDADLIESADGDVIALAGGCVCCAFGSDLVGALIALARRAPRPDHVLIETSGVALPGAVARTLTLVGGLERQAVLVVVDADGVRARADDRYVGDTVRRQLDEADLLVLNKVDLVGDDARRALHAWLGRAAPRARVIESEHGQVALEVALGTPLAGGAHGAGDVSDESRATLRPPAPGARAVFDSESLEFAHPVDARRLAAALAEPALGLVRAKALVRDLDGTPTEVQVVGAHWRARASAHRDPARGRLVCIGPRGRVERASLEALVRGCAACAREPGNALTGGTRAEEAAGR